MTAPRKWTIRDLDGSNPREVTLAEYKALIAARSAEAKLIFNAAAAAYRAGRANRMTIVLGTASLELVSHEAWGEGHSRQEYIARRGAAWCRVSTWNKGRIGSFGGSVWPASFPEFFEHVGPDKGAITHRSGPEFKAYVARMVRP